MSELRDFIYKISSEAEHRFDDLKLQFREKMGWTTVVHICPYITFGNSEFLFVKGRVLHDRGIQISNRDEFWDNLVNMYKRFNSHEIKGATLKATFQEITTEFVTDEDGYFGVSLPVKYASTIKGLWAYPEIELLSSPVPFNAPVKTVARVLVPGKNTRFGVISDIDDTILKTNALSLTKMIYHTFAHNAHTRMAYPGVGAFYRALQAGITGNDNNPIFYVSSSPWNLYDFIVEFMEINGIPVGPIFLKDYGFSHNKLFTEGHNHHKPKKIKKILDAYPELNFILIGDSGQEDPEIYSEIIKNYPGRILAVYIRDVTDDKRDHSVKAVFENHATEFVYSENSYPAAQHAASKGFIEARFLPEILKVKEKDENFEE